MKINGYPFSKHSYNGNKTKRNMLEVSAAALSAQRLDIEFYIVDACSHAFYLEVSNNQIELILTEAMKLSKAEVREWMHENF